MNDVTQDAGVARCLDGNEPMRIHMRIPKVNPHVLCEGSVSSPIFSVAVAKVNLHGISIFLMVC